MASPVKRAAARIVLLDPSNSVLLMHKDNRQGARWWSTPGGGLEEGETHEDAAAREIVEETGFTDVEIGPWIWSGTHVFSARGATYEQEERFFLARVDRPRPEVRLRPDPDELVAATDLRWWTIDELAATDEEVTPASLASLLRTLIQERPPEHPIEVDP